MFQVPPMKQLVPLLFGLEAAPVVFLPAPHVGVAEGPAERVRLAAGMVADALHASYARARRQRSGEPVMVIACPDCAAGRKVIVQRHGLDVLDELTGPMVWAWSEQEAASLLGVAGWKCLASYLDAIGHVDGGMRILLAVNDSNLEARVLRMGEAPSPAASPVPGNDTEAAGQ